MSSDEAAARATVERFFGAIEDMITGRGIATMVELWEHTPRVTSAHPTGDWARGWDQVLATWEVLATIGRPGSGGSRFRDLHVEVYGDVAYATSVFITAPAFGAMAMNCTEILHRTGGVWKLVHHHADRTPNLDSALEKMASE